MVFPEVFERLNALTLKYPDARLFAAAPPMINGYGMVNGFELHVQDREGRTVAMLDSTTRNFVDALARCPEIEMAHTVFSSDFPQYMLDMEAVDCERSGLSPSEVLSTISGYYGGQYISNFNR